MFEPGKDEGNLWEGPGQKSEAVIPSTTAPKGNMWGPGGNSTRVELKAGASSCTL